VLGRLLLAPVTGPSIFGVFALLGASLLLRRLFLGYSRPSRSYERLAPREIAFVLATVEALFPSRAELPVSGLDVDAPGYIDRLLDALHPTKRTQIRLLLCFFEQATLFWWAPGPRGWRRFSDLSLQQRSQVLENWNSSSVFLRRLVFTALRSVLGLAYLGNPATMRLLKVAPFDFASPVCEADLLYPPIGEDYDAIAYGVEDLTPPSDGTPIALDSPIHPDYAETPL
jgi:hypothetical protein